MTDEGAAELSGNLTMRAGRISDANGGESAMRRGENRRCARGRIGDARGGESAMRRGREYVTRA